MPTRRIYDQELHAHFVTFSCYRRRRLLDDDRAKRIVLGTLNSQLSLLAARCIGFVLMPNHVHALVWFSASGQLRTFMQHWKRTSSSQIRSFLQRVLPSYAAKVGDSPIWQAKYYGFNIYDTPKLEEKLSYMHQNPVRAGLVDHACDWPWSSARYYELGKSVGVKVGWIE
jgi:putative transposase